MIQKRETISRHSRLRPLRAQALEQAGFGVLFRRQGWWECLIQDGELAWLGRGATEEEALRNALAVLCPSPRARTLLVESLDRSCLEEGEPPRLRPAAPQEDRPEVPERELLENGPPPAAEEPVATGVPEEEPAPAEAEAEPELPCSQPEPAAGTDAKAPAEAPAAGDSGAAADIPEKAALLVEGSGKELASEREREPERPETEEDALGALDALETVIREARNDLAELSPPRIRWNMLGWIAEARQYQVRHPGAPKVRARVHGIAQVLQDLGREFWPGTVRAFQLKAGPRSAAELLGMPEKDAPSTWEEVAERARRRLEKDARRRGLDEDGWADAGCLDPPPWNPRRLLAEVRDRLVLLTGEVEGDARPAPGLRLDRDPALREELLLLARRLRWLRGATPDSLLWGRLAGRLRCLASRHRSLPELAQVLDDAYRPPAGSWARELGEDPWTRRRRGARAALASRLPEAGDAAALLSWLERAFEVFNNPEIAGLLEGRAEEVLALDARKALASPRLRRRLRRLQERLQEPDGANGGERERVLESLGGEEDGAGGAGGVEADPLAGLREQAREHTRGRRILFVGNRADPGLQATLERSLEPRLLDWSDGKPAALQSLAARIRQGRYDLVLLATGFLSHSGEQVLRRACAQARPPVPSVRAFKGRELAVLRAVLRDLGGMLAA